MKSKKCIENYNKKAELLSAYCGVAGSLIETYDPYYTLKVMLNEIHPVVVRAFRTQSRDNLSNLEKLADELEGRVLSLIKKNPGVEKTTKNHDIKEVFSRLEEIKSDYKKLNGCKDSSSKSVTC